MCTTETVFEKIQDDVLEISNRTVEASIYTHFILYKKWNNGVFHDDFMGGGVT